MNNIKPKHKNGVVYKKFEDLKISDIFLSGSELWIKIEQLDQSWFCELDQKWYYSFNSVCLNDGAIGLTDLDQECPVVKKLEYDV